MRIAFILTALMSLAACSSPFANPPSVYARFSDRANATLGLGWLLGYPCEVRSKTPEGIATSESLPDDQCYRFDAPERIEGVWENAFEGSAFYTASEYASGAWERRRGPDEQT